MDKCTEPITHHSPTCIPRPARSLPAAAVLTSPFTVTLATAAAASNLHPSTDALDVTFAIISRQRCRLAPPPGSGPFYRFPRPGTTFTVTLPPISSVACGYDTPKELEPDSFYETWSWNFYQVLGTKAGADLLGYHATTAVFDRPPDGACPPLYAPQIALQWFPQSSDSVAWCAQ